MIRLMIWLVALVVGLPQAIADDVEEWTIETAASGNAKHLCENPPGLFGSFKKRSYNRETHELVAWREPGQSFRVRGAYGAGFRNIGSVPVDKIVCRIQPIGGGITVTRVTPKTPEDRTAEIIAKYKDPKTRPKLRSEGLCSPVQLALEESERRVTSLEFKMKDFKFSYNRARAELTAPGETCHEELKRLVKAQEAIEAEAQNRTQLEAEESTAKKFFSTCMDSALRARHPDIVEAQRGFPEEIILAHERKRDRWLELFECKIDDLAYYDANKDTTEYLNMSQNLARHFRALRGPTAVEKHYGIEDR